MKKSRSKKNKNVDEIASAMMHAIETGGDMPKTADGKNPLAVLLGRMGGLKGGHARAASMTPQARSESAKRAAQARWQSKS